MHCLFLHPFLARRDLRLSTFVHWYHYVLVGCALVLLALGKTYYDGVRWEQRLNAAYAQCADHASGEQVSLQQALQEYDAWRSNFLWSGIIQWEGFPSTRLVIVDLPRNRVSFGDAAEAEMRHLAPRCHSS